MSKKTIFNSLLVMLSLVLAISANTMGQRRRSFQSQQSPSTPTPSAPPSPRNPMRPLSFAARAI